MDTRRSTAFAVAAVMVVAAASLPTPSNAARRHCGPAERSLTTPYSRRSPFNRPLPARPAIAADSAQLVVGISRAQHERGFVLAVRRWTVPVYRAATAPRLVDVPLTASWAPRHVLSDVPIPAGARPDPAGDGHLVVVDRAAGCEYDFWQARQANGSWSASWANVTPIAGNGIYPDGLGARASGFGLLAGLVFPQELRRGRIDHALVFSYPYTRRGAPASPATHSDGRTDDPGALPIGARVQLDPRLDLAALRLDPVARAIARALQVYGMYLADTGDAVSLYAVHAQSPGEGRFYSWLPRGENAVHLNRIPLDRLRVVSPPPSAAHSNG